MKKPVFAVLLFSLSALLVFMPKAYGAEAKAASYMGVDACKECHKAEYDSYIKSWHGKKMIKGSPAAKEGCESCHGPGEVHVGKGGGKAGIVSFNKKTPQTVKSKMCLQCHENEPEVASWNEGRHKTGGLSCDACHKAHSTGRQALKSNETTLCSDCHKDVRSRMNRQSRHPIAEGKVKCTSCHSPHGGNAKGMIKADSTPELCYGCHQEKRGSFAFEHPPVAENCGICHEPHGSNHNNMLISKAPQLCEGCHSVGMGHTSKAYTLQHGFEGAATEGKNRFIARGCLNCHGDIHGSNRSPLLVR